MGRSLIQTANQSSQTVALNSAISLGNVIRRFGCNCKLSGNAIEVFGEGYYTIDCTVTATPTAAGKVSIALFNNGVQIPGTLVSGGITTVGNSVTLPITTTIRQGCCSDGPNIITCSLLAGPGSIDNVSFRVIKE